MGALMAKNGADRNWKGRKNINRGFKKLRVWQDAVRLYVLACKIFSRFPYKLKKYPLIALMRLTAY